MRTSPDPNKNTSQIQRKNKLLKKCHRIVPKMNKDLCKVLAHRIVLDRVSRNNVINLDK